MTLSDNLQKILVAGAAGSLGRVLVREFLASERKVVAVCRNDREAADVGDLYANAIGELRCEVQISDLSDFPSVMSLAGRCGAVDGVVNAAGAFIWSPVAKAGQDDFEMMIDANLRTVWNLLRVFLPGMIERRFGRMVFVSAKGTLGQGGVGLGTYLAAKAGVNMLVQCAAEEVKDLDISINAVLPSIIDNAQNRLSMPDADPAKWVSPEGLSDCIAAIMGKEGRHLNGSLIPVSGRV